MFILLEFKRLLSGKTFSTSPPFIVCVCVYRCIMCKNVPPEINVIFIRTCQIHKQTIFECTFILAQNEVVSYFDLAAQWIMKPSVSEGALSVISSPTRVISALGVKG